MIGKGSVFNNINLESIKFAIQVLFSIQLYQDKNLEININSKYTTIFLENLVGDLYQLNSLSNTEKQIEFNTITLRLFYIIIIGDIKLDDFNEIAGISCEIDNSKLISRYFSIYLLPQITNSHKHNQGLVIKQLLKLSQNFIPLIKFLEILQNYHFDNIIHDIIRWLTKLTIGDLNIKIDIKLFIKNTVNHCRTYFILEAFPSLKYENPPISLLFQFWISAEIEFSKYYSYPSNYSTFSDSLVKWICDSSCALKKEKFKQLCSNFNIYSDETIEGAWTILSSNSNSKDSVSYEIVKQVFQVNKVYHESTSVY